MKYAVYAENLDGERRFLDHCTGDNVGRGIFDLYADERGDEEEIVVVPVEESPGAVLGKIGGHMMKTTLREIIETSGLDPEDGGRPEYWWNSLYMDYPAHKLAIIEGCDAWIAGEIVLVDWDSGSQFYTEAQARKEFPELFTVRDAATALGKRGGSVKSPRKAASSRENGKKGGRPKKEVAK